MTLPPEHRDLDIGNNRQGDGEFYQLMPGMCPHPAPAPYHVRGPQTAGAPVGQVGAANPSGGREANKQQEEGRSKPARLGPPMGFCGAGHPEHGCRACRWEAGPGCAAAESAVPEAALPSACPCPALPQSSWIPTSLPGHILFSPGRGTKGGLPTEKTLPLPPGG